MVAARFKRSQQFSRVTHAGVIPVALARYGDNRRRLISGERLPLGRSNMAVKLADLPGLFDRNLTLVPVAVPGCDIERLCRIWPCLGSQQ